MPISDYISRFEKPGEKDRPELGKLFHFKRKISFPLSIPFVHLPFSPNQITILSNIVQLIGITLIGFTTGYFRLLGLAIYYLGDVLDFVDGNIARYRNQTSTAGVFLDQLGHVAVTPLLFVALGHAAYVDSENILFLYGSIFLALFPALISFQLVAIHQFIEKDKEAPSNNSADTETGVKYVIKKIISSIFHFKAEIILIGIILNSLPTIAVLYLCYFPIRFCLQAILDTSRIQAQKQSTID